MGLAIVRKAASAAVIALSIAGCQAGMQHGFAYIPNAHDFAMPANVRVIYSFSGPPLGELPEASPIVDAAGRLYGTTVYGGTNSSCGSGCGTIYQLSPAAHGTWKEKTLWSFDLTNGAYPGYPLVTDAAGGFYSTTQVGGNLGVAYGLSHRTNAWELQVLHNFQGGSDGAQPRSSLIFDKIGNLYGTTVSGGSGGSGGGGTVYELVRAGSKWTEKILYHFPPYYTKNGANPQAPPVLKRGSLYGTTSYGGNSACPSGCGVIFKLTSAGKGSWSESVLHEFSGADGCTSVAGLVADAAGNFYGSTNLGGPSNPSCLGGCGTLFELTHVSHGHWSFAVIHDFNASTGCGPTGNMVFDAAGNLYGTAIIGGNASVCHGNCGVVFKLVPLTNHHWKYSVLHNFNDTPDGSEPSGLVMGGIGKLYGTTRGGGALGLGAVFEVTP